MTRNTYLLLLLLYLFSHIAENFANNSQKHKIVEIGVCRWFPVWLVVHPVNADVSHHTEFNLDLFIYVVYNIHETEKVAYLAKCLPISLVFFKRTKTNYYHSAACLHFPNFEFEY